MKTYVSFILLILMGWSFAQVKTLTGSIYIDNTDDALPKSGVRVDNLRSYAKTYTNADGYFSIPMLLGDTIQFSAPYLDTRKIIVSKNIYEKGVLQAHLNVETIELDEAYIGKLNPYLKDNVKIRRDIKNDLYNQIGLDQRIRDLEPKKDISRFKATDIMNPVRVIGHINGYYKKQRRIQLFEQKQGIYNEVINYFPDEYFIDQLKLPDYKVHEFLEYAANKINLKGRVLNRQFELLGLELEPVAELYLKELYQNTQS